MDMIGLAVTLLHFAVPLLGGIGLDLPQPGQHRWRNAAAPILGD